MLVQIYFLKINQNNNQIYLAKIKVKMINNNHNKLIKI